jgi:hypothetical protein
MPYVKQERRLELASRLNEIQSIIDNDVAFTFIEILHHVVSTLSPDMFKTPNELSSGDMNYLITQGCLYYLSKTEGKYADHQEIVDSLFEVRDSLPDHTTTIDNRRGALLCCALEFYRRKIAPYEDEKRICNGDVY